jgi:hypothetical protein
MHIYHVRGTPVETAYCTHRMAVIYLEQCGPDLRVWRVSGGLRSGPCSQVGLRAASILFIAICVR